MITRNCWKCTNTAATPENELLVPSSVISDTCFPLCKNQPQKYCRTFSKSNTREPSGISQTALGHQDRLYETSSIQPTLILSLSVSPFRSSEVTDLHLQPQSFNFSLSLFSYLIMTTSLYHSLPVCPQLFSVTCYCWCSYSFPPLCL